MEAFCVQEGGDFGKGEFRGENFAVKKSGQIFPLSKFLQRVTGEYCKFRHAQRCTKQKEGTRDLLFATCNGCARNALECRVAPGFEKKTPLVSIKRMSPSVLLSRDPLSLETANLQACNANHVASSYWSLCAHGCHLSGLRFRSSFVFFAFWLCLASRWIKFYCIRQVHLAEHLPEATHRQNRVKNK